MANAEHVSELFKGADSWNQWRELFPDVLPDLSHIDFSKQNNIEALWDSENQRVNLTGFNLRSVIFDNCNLRGARLWMCDLRSARCHWVNLNEANLFGAQLQGADCFGCTFDNADLSDAKLEGAKLGSASLKSSLCINANFEGSSVKAADFSGADLRGVAFAPWKVSLSGAPLIPKEYPDTPVNEIRGLSRSTRRIVESAQHVRDLWEVEDGWKVGLRLWGVSCGYGQDLMRWMFLSLVIVALFCGAFTKVDLYHAVSKVETVIDKGGMPHLSSANYIGKPSAVDAFYFSVVTFTTLGFGDIAPVSHAGKALVVIEVLVGYAMLGGLVSILANKLQDPG